MGGPDLDHFSSITPNLFRFADTCNVYVLRKGRQAILVDFGSGHVLEHLAEIGVDQVAAILHTHHHRDQAQGDPAAQARGIPIHVPQHERQLFDQAETYWSTKQLYDIYNVRNTYFSLTKSVAVAGVLEDWEAFEWMGIRLDILPTPGHTVGSISLLGGIDGVPVAFVGDLLHSPGKVQTLYDMQYSYGAMDGLESTILSLNLLEERQPGVLCPSHGEVMPEPGRALGLTRDALRSLFRLESGGQLAADEIDFTPVASRLLASVKTCSSFYVILSRDRTRALFVDFGSPNYSLLAPATHRFEPGERARFIPHSLARLRRQYGVKRVEAVIPSHYHDDHINGIPYLQRSMGTEVWAYENMKEALERPGTELIGCVFPDPLRVARTFGDGERFSWEGFDFEAFYSPGHCDYHLSLFTTMDGKRIAFSGDNVWPPGFVPSLIYRNHVHRTSHQRTARLYREYRPEILCSGHGLFTNVAPEGYDLFLSNAERLTSIFETLLPEGTGIIGLEPSWIQIVPYQMRGAPGSAIRGEVRVKNPVPREVEVHWAWSIPDGWTVDPAEGSTRLASGASTQSPFVVTIPEQFSFLHPKQAVTLEVALEGRSLGQIAEAVVENRPYGAAGAPP